MEVSGGHKILVLINQEAGWASHYAEYAVPRPSVNFYFTLFMSFDAVSVLNSLFQFTDVTDRGVAFKADCIPYTFTFTAYFLGHPVRPYVGTNFA